MNNLDLTKVDEKMKSVYLVLGIYEFRDIQNDDNEKIYDQIILNEKILNMIDTINFIYVKDGLEPSGDTIKKVGYLTNLQVYLDPQRISDNIIFTNDDKDTFELEVLL